MRVRMIRPSYWTDADLHTRLSAEQREFYIGLWMLADDAGYVAWDVDRVGAELYPYRTHAWRTKRLTEWLVAIGENHARLLDCGRHVLVPNLSSYQAPPKPAYPIRKAHEACLQRVPRGASGGHVAAGGTSTGREGEGRGLEEGAHAREDENLTDFQRKVPRPVALGGRTA